MQQAGYPLLKIVASDTYIKLRPIGANHSPRVRDISDALCLLSIYAMCQNTLSLSNRIIMCWLQSRQAALGVVRVQSWFMALVTAVGIIWRYQRNRISVPAYFRCHPAWKLHVFFNLLCYRLNNWWVWWVGHPRPQFLFLYRVFSHWDFTNWGK